MVEIDHNRAASDPFALTCLFAPSKSNLTKCTYYRFTTLMSLHRVNRWIGQNTYVVYKVNHFADIGNLAVKWRPRALLTCKGCECLNMVSSNALTHCSLSSAFRAKMRTIKIQIIIINIALINGKNTVKVGIFTNRYVFFCLWTNALVYKLLINILGFSSIHMHIIDLQSLQKLNPHE